MELNYYVGDQLSSVEVFSACPGCGKIEHLAMHAVPISYCHKTYKFYVQCNCGWTGPDAKKASIAAMFWDARIFEKVVS